MSTVSPINTQSPPPEWINMQITNAMGSGTIVVRNPTLKSGEFIGDYPSREHTHGAVHNRSIYPGMLQNISAKGYRGTSGSIPLYEGSRLICTLSWNCPGGGRRNSLQKYYLDGNYLINIGAFNETGPIGDVNITIYRA